MGERVRSLVLLALSGCHFGSSYSQSLHPAWVMFPLQLGVVPRERAGEGYIKRSYLFFANIFLYNGKI